MAKHILPAALVAGFLFYFFSDALNRHFSLDDCFYDGLVRKFGIGGSIEVCYDLANGRWFSHILCAFSFYFFEQGFFRYGLYLTFLLILFLLGVKTLYKNYSLSFLKTKPSLFSQMTFSFVFTATVYFLQFEGRWETWGWVSSANTHLMSVIVSLFLFSLLIKENKSFGVTVCVCLLSAFMGGLNEMNAICTVLLICGLFLLNKFSHLQLNKLNLGLGILCVAVSLFVNTYSGGYKLRMEGLPDFTILQSVKNTIHSFVLPVLHVKSFIFSALALLIFILFMVERMPRPNKKYVAVFSFTLLIATFSFFLHCYALSDIVPARGAVWAYCLLLFVLAAPFISSKNISN